MLHQNSTFSHKADRIDRLQPAGHRDGCVFAKAQSRCNIWFYSTFHQNFCHGKACCYHGRCVYSVWSKRLFSSKHNAFISSPSRSPASSRRLSDTGAVFVKICTHATFLRPLSRIDKCNLTHIFLILQLLHFGFIQIQSAYQSVCFSDQFLDQ